jgi:hypothetical protein
MKGLAHWPRGYPINHFHFGSPKFALEVTQSIVSFFSPSRLVSLPVPLAHSSPLVSVSPRVYRANASTSRSFSDPKRATNCPRRSRALTPLHLTGSHRLSHQTRPCSSEHVQLGDRCRRASNRSYGDINVYPAYCRRRGLH